MYSERPVPVPEVPGKITLRKKGKSTYVQYETERIYDPATQKSRVRRSEIGILIPSMPELMLPNDNYLIWFPEGSVTPTEKEADLITQYEEGKQYNKMLREFFNYTYYQFESVSKKRPDSLVSLNQVQRFNRVLKQLIEVMKDEPYAQFLETIPEPVIEKNEEGETRIQGLTYSDVSLLLAQFKQAVNTYFLWM